MQFKKAILGWLAGTIGILIFVLCVSIISSSNNTQQKPQEATVQFVSKNNYLRCTNSDVELPITIDYSTEPKLEKFIINDDSIALAGLNSLNKDSGSNTVIDDKINHNVETENNNQLESQNINYLEAQNLKQSDKKNTNADEIAFTGKETTWSNVIYDSDLYWLSKLINAEAEGEPYIGKIAVGNVIMNRVTNTKYFDNTIKSVIFASGQFEVVGNRLNLTPTQESINAAYDVIYNEKIAYDMPAEVFYFNTSGEWWKGITVWKKIGNHYFGYQNY